MVATVAKCRLCDEEAVWRIWRSAIDLDSGSSCGGWSPYHYCAKHKVRGVAEAADVAAYCNQKLAGIAVGTAELRPWSQP